MFKCRRVCKAPVGHSKCRHDGSRTTAALAKPRRKNEVSLFVVDGDSLSVTRVDRARIERKVGPPYLVDARNH